MSLPLPRFTTVKPPYGAVLDTEHPLYSAVSLCMPINEGGGGVHELVSGMVGAPGTASAWSVSPFGPAVNFNGTTASMFTFPRFVRLPAAGNTLLIIYMLRTTGGGGFASTFATVDSVGNSIATWTGSSGTLSVGYSSNGTSYFGPGVAAGTWYTTTLIPAAAGNYGIQNGVGITGTSAGASGTAPTTLLLGAGVTSGFAADGMVAYVVGFNRLLTNTEREFIWNAPFSLLTLPSATRRYYLGFNPATTPSRGVAAPLSVPKLRYNTVKPPLGAVLDTEHPLYKDLVVVMPLNEGGGGSVRELISGKPGVFGTGVSWTQSPFGPALLFNNTAAATVSWPAGTVSIPVAATVLAIFNVASVTSTFGGIVQVPCVGNVQFNLYVNNTGPIQVVGNNGQYLATNSVTLGQWHVLTALATGATLANAVIDNGVRSAGGTNAVVTPVAESLQLGNLGTAWNLNGSIAYIVVFGRTLSDSERQSIALAPFSLFISPNAVREHAVFGTTVTSGYLRSVASTIAGLATTLTHVVSMARTLQTAIAPNTVGSRRLAAVRTVSSSVVPTTAATRRAQLSASVGTSIVPQTTVVRSATTTRVAASNVAPQTTVSSLHGYARSAGSNVAPLDTVTRVLARRPIVVTVVAPLTALTRLLAAMRTASTTVQPTTSNTRAVGQARSSSSTVAPSNLVSRIPGVGRIVVSTRAPTTALLRIAAALRSLGTLVQEHTTASSHIASSRSGVSVVAPNTHAVSLRGLGRTVHSTTVLHTLVLSGLVPTPAGGSVSYAWTSIYSGSVSTQAIYTGSIRTQAIYTGVVQREETY